jgi:hypothetical protein
MLPRVSWKRMAPYLPWLLLGCAYAVSLLFLTHDWGAGIDRAVLLLLLAGLALLARPGLAAPPAGDGPPLLRSLQVASAACLAASVAVGASSVVYSATHGDIRLDQGQNTYRAARLLLRGEDPWGQGMILDLVAFRERARERGAAGYPVGRSDTAGYWRTLSESDRAALLRSPRAPSAASKREAALLGHKYGPADVLSAVPFVVVFGEAGIPLLNLLCWLGFVATFFHLLRDLDVAPAARWAALLFVVADPHATWNYLYNSASDIRALLPLALAVRAWARRRPVTLGAWLGVSFCVKLLPAALYLPLAVAMPAALPAFAVVVAILMTPFVMWDAYGIVHLLFLYPLLYRAPDTTSWLGMVQGGPTIAALRAAFAAAALFFGARVALRRARAPLRDLAVLTVLAILSGSQFHNNYVSWLPWIFALAVVKELSAPPASSPPSPARSESAKRPAAAPAPQGGRRRRATRKPRPPGAG